VHQRIEEKSSLEKDRQQRPVKRAQKKDGKRDENLNHIMQWDASFLEKL